MQVDEKIGGRETYFFGEYLQNEELKAYKRKFQEAKKTKNKKPIL